MKPWHLLFLTVPLAACQQATAPAGAPPGAAAASDDRAFVQASCGSCHAVAGPGASPHSAAPPFPAIVNQEGLTAETLSTWLRGAHNYPREMDFYLGDREVERLVRYMLTLKDPNYRRPPD